MVITRLGLTGVQEMKEERRKKGTCKDSLIYLAQFRDPVAKKQVPGLAQSQSQTPCFLFVAVARGSRIVFSSG